MMAVNEKKKFFSPFFLCQEKAYIHDFLLLALTNLFNISEEGANITTLARRRH
jgi:hypothetical protein